MRLSPTAALALPVLAIPVLAALSLAAARPAAAQVTINFDSLSSSPGAYPGQPYDIALQGYSYTSQGYTLHALGIQGYASTKADGTRLYDGETSLFTDTQGPFTKLTKDDGTTFTLNSIDLGLANQQSPSPGFVTFFGATQGGGIVIQTFNLPAKGGFFKEQFDSSFTNLTSVDFEQQGAVVQFDNIVLNAPASTPEPSSFAAFGFIGLGLAGLVLKARKKAAGDRPGQGLPREAAREAFRGQTRSPQ